MIVATIQAVLRHLPSLQPHVAQHDSYQEVVRKLRSTLQFSTTVIVRALMVPCTLGIHNSLKGRAFGWEVLVGVGDCCVMRWLLSVKQTIDKGILGGLAKRRSQEMIAQCAGLGSS